MKDDAFQKPIITAVNSFTQLVSGHVHLTDMGQQVAREIEAAGGVAKEFSAIAVDEGRFSGGTSGSIGHVSPEAASGGVISLIKNGDNIKIDIPNRSINLLISDEELAARRVEQDKLDWKLAKERPRKVSTVLKAYAAFVTRADKGVVRDLSMLDD